MDTDVGEHWPKLKRDGADKIVFSSVFTPRSYVSANIPHFVGRCAMVRGRRWIPTSVSTTLNWDVLRLIGLSFRAY